MLILQSTVSSSTVSSGRRFCRRRFSLHCFNRRKTEFEQAIAVKPIHEAQFIKRASRVLLKESFVLVTIPIPTIIAARPPRPRQKTPHKANLLLKGKDGDFERFHVKTRDIEQNVKYSTVNNTVRAHVGFHRSVSDVKLPS
jgi:hypothetical protein